MSIAADASPIETQLEHHRRALTGYCYRMLGSGSEAEDAVQETFIRAWRKSADLQDRAALKGWMYRIAHNVCLDMMSTVQRRAQPMDLGPASSADAALGDPSHEWITPIADARVIPEEADPAAVADARETLRLAFVAALQHLPARQRAVLVLCEVLKWQATEVAELLDTSVASVNSALQRSRATLAKLELDKDGPVGAVDGDEAELVAKYVQAFEAYDIQGLVGLLRDDAKFSMPPWPLWVQGHASIAQFMERTAFKCEGSKMQVVAANGGPAVALYNPAEDGDGFTAWAVVVVETSAGQISGLHHFIGDDVFASFGLPVRLPA